MHLMPVLLCATLGKHYKITSVISYQWQNGISQYVQQKEHIYTQVYLLNEGLVSVVPHSPKLKGHN